MRWVPRSRSCAWSRSYSSTSSASRRCPKVAPLSLGELESAERVIQILATRPSGHLTPGLRAHLARGRALVASARGQHGEVEAGLRDAIDRFSQIGWVYWQAVTEVDLATWLIDRDRGNEAAPLLAHAISVLAPLRAMPALNRATRLSDTIGIVGTSPASAR